MLEVSGIESWPRQCTEKQEQEGLYTPDPADIGWRNASEQIDFVERLEHAELQW